MPAPAYTLIHDTMTASLELCISPATANKIKNLPAKRQGTSNAFEWEFVEGEISKKSRTYSCYLRRVVKSNDRNDKSKIKKIWFSTITYILEGIFDGDKASPLFTLRIKSNPTAISLGDYSTRKADITDDELFLNAIDLLGDIYGPIFSKDEQRRIDNHEFAISDVEVAIPFECKSDKDLILRTLRSIYATDLTLEDGRINVGEALGLRIQVFDKDKSDKGAGEKNLSVSAYQGANHQFTVTFYDKAREMKNLGKTISPSDVKVWDKALRMDIRMTRDFLRRIMGEKPSLKKWLEFCTAATFQSTLHRIIISTFRLYDLTIPAADLNSLSARIRKLSPKLHEHWQDSLILSKQEVSEFANYEAFRVICEKYSVRPSTGGLLLGMAVKTGMFENITQKEFIESSARELYESISNKRSNTVSKIAVAKENIRYTLETLCWKAA